MSEVFLLHTPAVALSLIPGTFEWAKRQLAQGRRVTRKKWTNRRIIPHGQKFWLYVGSEKIERYKPIGLDHLAEDWTTL